MSTSVPLSEVYFDDSTRSREDLQEGKLLELMESMKFLGRLIHPIVVERQKGSAPDGTPYVHPYKLIAGRRRLEAAFRLNWSGIDADFWDELTPLKRKVIEFDENHKRAQLTWSEEATAIKELHELLAAESTSKHTIDDTAQALGLSFGKIAEDLKLAQAVEEEQEKVLTHPTRKGALIAYKREREIGLLRELARRRTAPITPLTTQARILGGGIMYEDSCLNVLRKMETDSIDLIVTDPPWGINVGQSTPKLRERLMGYDDLEATTVELFNEVFPQLFRVLKPTCHLYIFYDISRHADWISALVKAGFCVRTRPLIWFKHGQPGISDVYTNFMTCYEPVLWAYKPGPEDIFRFMSKPAVEGWYEPRPAEVTQTHHPNEKPMPALRAMVEQSSNINEIVLDPFAGGGSTLQAAFELGRFYIGIENDPGYAADAFTRLQTLEEMKVIEDVYGIDYGIGLPKDIAQ